MSGLKRRKPPSAEQPNAEKVAQFHRIARLMDSCIVIPGTEIRIGLDPIIGLVPGIGDAIGALWSAYLIESARRLGLPRSALHRMWLNVAIDTVCGLLPVLGDLFDFYWDANARNKRILDHYLEQHTEQTDTTKD